MPWPKPTRSRTIYRNLKTVFGTEPPKLVGYVLTLCVLFEDLRLELGEWDYNEPERTLYFLRRSIATLREFADTARTLNGLAEFEPIRRRFAPEQRAQWNVAIAYLAQHKARIDKERNVYGGHVSAGAVQNAVEQFPLGKKQALEIEWIERSSSTRVGPRFRFAPDLMGRVMLHGHDSDADELTYLRELMALTAEGFEHATNCTMLITDVYVAPHFGF